MKKSGKRIYLFVKLNVIIPLIIILAVAGSTLVFIKYYTDLNTSNPNAGNALLALATILLVVAAFMQMNTQITEAKDRKNSVNRVFIERIKNWIDVMDKSFEIITKGVEEIFNTNTFTLTEAAAMDASIRAEKSGAKIVMSHESEDALKSANSKIFKWFSNKNYILLNALKRTDEYQTLLKESNLLTPESMSKLISLFDYIHIFNAQWDETDEADKTALVLSIIPMMKVLCIECLFYLFRDGNLEKPNKKIIQEYNKYLKEYYKPELTDKEEMNSKIKVICDEFDIKLDNKL